MSNGGLPKEVAELLVELGELEPLLPDKVLLSSNADDEAQEVPDAPPEPVYPRKVRDDIQGNIIPGFNKDHQHFLFFRIRSKPLTKTWLQWIAPQISSMDDVIAFVRMHRSLRMRLGVREPGLKATWLNIAFSNAAIARLTDKDTAAAFGERSFRQGLAARSTYLGDPTNTKSRGNAGRWVVGGPKNEADILVILAADDPDDLVATVEGVKARAETARLELLFEQRGDTLPGRLRGHEHFGFKDGVSQPGVRGRVSSATGDFITPRYIDVSDPRARLFARPGQVLVWPGQFLLGEPRQDPENLYAPATRADARFPRWARRGSYLVCRRLAQDVPAFWSFATASAAEVGLPARRFAAMLVGRWPSGAPLLRTPSADDAALAGDEWANNHFIFDDDTRPSNLRPIPGYGGDVHPDAQADVLGAVCPHFAHIRKANPRDSATDLGKPADTLIRHLLRRGIPFGAPLVGVKEPPPKLIKQERGLMFISYAATIEDQFEFLTRRWANSPAQPNFGGHDAIIGQVDRAGSRTRSFDFPGPGGTARLSTKRDWVTPTGGGYFFAPPIGAISRVLGA
jgi:Dyp-type peroxidase family